MLRRIAYIDSLKCLAIYLVLLGHCLQHLSVADRYHNPAFLFITSFHMPLFMLLTGFFAGKSLNLSFSRLLQQKSVRILLPTLVWSLIFLAISNICGIPLPGYASAPDYIIGNLWFLKSAFICYILHYLCFKPVMRSAAGGSHTVAPLIYASIISLLISQILPLYKVNFMYPCFLAGYLIHDRLPLIIRYRTPLLILSILLYLAIFLTIPDSYYTAMPMIKEQLLSGDLSPLPLLAGVQLTRITMGISASLALIIIFHQYLKTDVLAPLGRRPLLIYILQSFLLEVILPHTVRLDTNASELFTLIYAPILSALILLLLHHTAGLLHKTGPAAILLTGRY